MNLPYVRGKKRTGAYIALTGILLYSLYFFFYVFTPSGYLNAKEATLVPFTELKSSDRLTVVAPHLDDEGLGVGGLVAEARQKGIPVSIIFMTNGDGNYYGAGIQLRTVKPSRQAYVDYGKLRQYEALNATAKLGIPKENVYFMGLPDRGLGQLLTPKYYTTPYTSSYTGKTSSPYPLSSIPQLQYTGKASQSALLGLLNDTAPTLVFAPLLEDRHPDHSATGKYVQMLLPSISSRPRAYLYLVHYPKYPLPRGINPALPLLPPQKLQSKKWETIPLSPSAVEEKRQSVELYVSQLKIPEVRTLLRSLVRRNELVVDGF